MKIDNLTHLLDQLGGDGAYRVVGDHLQVNCIASPWTHDSGSDSSQKLGILLTDETTLAHCFYPGCFGGNIQQLIEKVGRLRIGDGLMTLEQMSQLRAFALMAEEDGEVDVRPRKARGTFGIPAELKACLADRSPYFASRGVTGPSSAWPLGEWGGRAWLTLAMQHGEPSAVQGRLLGATDADGRDEKFRTVPTGFLKGEQLAGAWAVPAGCLCLVVVESPLDALLLNSWLEGASAVATMGAEPSDEQETQLLDLLGRGGELVCAYDRDPAGQLGQRQLAEWAAKRIGRVSVVTWMGKDPSDDSNGTLTVPEVRERAQEAFTAREPWLLARLTRLLTL